MQRSVFTDFAGWHVSYILSCGEVIRDKARQRHDVRLPRYPFCSGTAEKTRPEQMIPFELSQSMTQQWCADGSGSARFRPCIKARFMSLFSWPGSAWIIKLSSQINFKVLGGRGGAHLEP